MDRKIIIIALLLLSLAIVVLLNKFGPSQIVLIPFGLILLSSVFFSRGILIFLTLLCLQLGGFPYFGIYRTTLLPQLRWVFFTLFCLHVFGDIFLGRTVRRIKFFDILAMVFIIYAFISVFYSFYPKITLERSTTILVLYISVFWIIWKYAYDQSPEKVIYLILRVMWLVFIMSYLMLFFDPYRAFISGRFSGIFGNANGLGIVCAINLPISLWHFLETKKKSAFFLFFLMSVALLLSGARGSMNATAFSLGYFIYVRSKKYRPLILFSAISLILILIWIIEALIRDFFMVYIRAGNIPLLGGRLMIWPTIINLIMDKPIFGYGFGVEDKLPALGKLAFLWGMRGIYVHSSYLGMLLQLGIVGFIIFFVPLFILLFKELSLRPEGQVPLLRYALRAVLIAGLICSIYETWIYSAGNVVAFLFWVIIMLLVFYRHQERSKMTPEGT